MRELPDLAQLQSMQVLAWTLVHFLWQGAVLGLGAFLVLRLVRPERASTRYAVSVTTLALMLVTSAATLLALSRQPIAREAITVDTVTRESSTDSPSALAMSPSAPTPAIAADEAASPIGPAPLGPGLLLMILACWSLGVCALSVRLIGGWVMTRHLARSAIDGVAPSIESAARRIAARLHVRRRVAIFESGAVLVPTLIGWIKPVVLLPASALAGLSPAQLEAILAHELAHVRRHDYLINLLQSVIETLLFYHPAVWWVSARVRAEREHCCDDLAVDVCGDRLVYVSALAELTTLANRRSLALAATDGSLVGRVRRILGGPRPTSEPAPAWALLALVALVVGSAGTFGAAAPNTATPAMTAAVVAPLGTITWDPPAGAPFREAVVAQPAAVASADAQQSPEIEMLRAEQDRLRREADRLQREVERMRAAEARLRARQNSWFTGWFDGFAAPPAPPVPPVPPEPPVPPVPPVPPAPPLAEFAPVPPAPPMAPLPPMPPYPSRAPLPPVPPVPPAPPAPPMPPAPPAPPEIQARGNGNFSWSNNGETLQMRWTGAFRLSDDERDIASVEEGETVTIGDGVSRVEVRGLSGGRIERTFRKDGATRAFEPEGRLFLAEMLTRIVRRSGMFARERVARFLKQGGPDAVFAEIDRLDNSSYVRRVYYTELLQQAQGTDALVTQVLQRVRSELKSDYDKRMVLTAIAKRPNITDAQRVIVATVAATVGSDYDQRVALEAVLDPAATSPAVAAAVVETTASIGSNYDRRLVLTELARKGGLSDPTADAFFTATSGISSSYDKSLVLRQVAALPAPTDRILQDLLRTASGISSNHDKANVLVDVAGRHHLSDAARQLYVRAAEDIGSSYDSNRALAALARTR